MTKKRYTYQYDQIFVQSELSCYPCMCFDDDDDDFYSQWKPMSAWVTQLTARCGHVRHPCHSDAKVESYHIQCSLFACVDSYYVSLAIHGLGGLLMQPGRGCFSGQGQMWDGVSGYNSYKIFYFTPWNPSYDSRVHDEVDDDDEKFTS